MFSLGFHLRPERHYSMLVNVRTGQVVAEGTLTTDAVKAAGISTEQIIGVGVAPAVGIHAPINLLESLGLPAGTRQVIARSDRHACVPGCGVASPSTAVLILDDDLHLLMNSRLQRDIPGVASAEPDAILPGYFAYVVERIGLLREVSDQSMIESAAFTLRGLVESMQAAGVPVRRFVAMGMHRSNQLLVQILSDVLNERISVPSTREPAALGAAVLAALAAGPAVTGHAHASLAIHAMTSSSVSKTYRPDLVSRRKYNALYAARSAK